MHNLPIIVPWREALLSTLNPFDWQDVHNLDYSENTPALFALQPQYQHFCWYRLVICLPLQPRGWPSGMLFLQGPANRGAYFSRRNQFLTCTKLPWTHLEAAQTILCIPNQLDIAPHVSSSNILHIKTQEYAWKKLTSTAFVPLSMRSSFVKTPNVLSPVSTTTQSY